MIWLQFFVEVGGIKTPVSGAVKIQDGLELFERHMFGAGAAHPSVKDAVIAAFFVSCFPTFHRAVRDADDIGSLNPEDLARNGL